MLTLFVHIHNLVGRHFFSTVYGYFVPHSINAMMTWHQTSTEIAYETRLPEKGNKKNDILQGVCMFPSD